MELSDKIKESIDPIKKHIEGDGGSVEFIELTDNLIVKLKVSGSTKPCFDCPDPMKYCTPCFPVTIGYCVNRIQCHSIPKKIL